MGGYYCNYLANWRDPQGVIHGACAKALSKTWLVSEILGDGNSNIFQFHPGKLGKMNPFWRAYFWDGLKPSTRISVTPKTQKVEFVDQQKGSRIESLGRWGLGIPHFSRKKATFNFAIVKLMKPQSRFFWRLTLMPRVLVPPNWNKFLRGKSGLQCYMSKLVPTTKTIDPELLLIVKVKIMITGKSSPCLMNFQRYMMWNAFQNDRGFARLRTILVA